MNLETAINECPEITEDHLTRLKASETTEDFNLDLNIELLLEPSSPFYSLAQLCGELERRCIQRLLCAFCQLLHELPSRADVVQAMSLYFDILSYCEGVHQILFKSFFFRATMRCLSRVIRQPKSEDEVPQMEYKPLLVSFVRSLKKVKLGTSYDSLSFFLDGFANLATFPADIEVCDLAFQALTILIENASSPRILCSYVFRLILNALLMTQKKHGALNKSVLQISDRALKFVQKVAQNFPDLLIPSPVPEPVETTENLDNSNAEPEKVLMKQDTNAGSDDKENEENANAADTTTEEDPMKYDPYLGLIEFMCIYTPDRQDYRQHTQEKVMNLMKPELYLRFNSFIRLLSLCDNPSRRTIACDMSVALIQTCKIDGDLSEFLRTVVERTNDAMPSVRCKALLGLATGLCSLPELIRMDVLDSANVEFIDVVQIFILRASDKKPVVRKAALAFFDQLLEVSSSLLQSPRIRELLISLAQDSSVSVRKAALQSFANMLQYPSDECVVTDWSKAILPSIADAESSVSEKAAELIAQEVFNPIVALPNSPFDPKQRVYILLSKLNEDGIEFLQRSLTLSLKRNEFKPEALIRGLEFVLKNCLRLPIEEWAVDMWSLMDELSAKVPEKVDAHLIMQIWDRIKDDDGKHGNVMRKTLTILANVTCQLSETERDSLLELEKRILTFSVAPDVIRDIMKVLARLRTKSRGWRHLVMHMEDPLMLLSLGENIHPELSSRILFTLGEIALADESMINKSILAALKAVVSNAVTRRNGESVNLRVRDRAHGLAALAKLCLRREDLAKQYVDIFVHHLSPSEAVPIRANALIALGDLAVHYTSLVDRFVPMMSDCLRDPCVCLRLQAVMTIASLLAEEFIKFRGTTMLRLVYGLSDPCDDVRYFVESVFSRILMPRNPSVFANNFLDVICALNNFTGLANYQGALGNEDFSLLDSPHRRSMLYRFMLGKLPAEQRFIVCAGIVQELLAAFTEGETPLPIPERTNHPVAAVLTDSLALLCGPELRVCFRHNKQGEEEEMEEDAVKQRAVLSVLKQNITDHVVPILLALRTKLQNGNSPFLRDVTICLREILKDFKENIEEVVHDSLLAKEIRFDMEQLDGDAVISLDIGRKSVAVMVNSVSPSLSMLQGEIALADGRKPPTESPAVSTPTKYDNGFGIRNMEAPLPPHRFSSSNSSDCPVSFEGLDTSPAHGRRFSGAVPRRLSFDSNGRPSLHARRRRMSEPVPHRFSFNAFGRRSLDGLEQSQAIRRRLSIEPPLLPRLDEDE